MNKPFWIRRSFVCFASLLFLLSFICPCSDSSADSRQSEGQRLAMTLTIEKTSQCLKSDIALMAEITNKGDEAVSIDPGFMFYKISLIAKAPKSGAGGSSYRSITGDPGPSYENSFIVLGPGQSYKKSFKLFQKDDFFKASTNYTVAVTYGQFGKTELFNGTKIFRGTVESNTVVFNLSKCRENANRRKSLF